MHERPMSEDAAIERLPPAYPPAFASTFPFGPLYPFPSRFATVGRTGAGASQGHRMHYVDEGSGPVVVCLHGNPTWGFQFRNLIASLRQDFRVIVPDHVGCGLSDQPKDVFFTAADRIAHLEDLLEQLGVVRFSLVMHDWGGPIGTGLAVRRPADIERLVYFNTILAEMALLPGMIRRAASPLIGRLLTQHTMRFVKLLTSFGAVHRLSPEIKQGYHRPYRTRASRRAIWGFVRDIPFTQSHPTAALMDDMVARLPSLAAKPVKIIWGMNDPCFHPEILRHVAARFPQADVVKIPAASHLVLEDAAKQSLSEVQAFLRPLVSGSDRETVVAPRLANNAPLDVRFDTAAEARSPVNGLYAALQSAAAAAPWVSAVTKVSFPRWSDRPQYDAIDFAALSARINAYENGLAAAGLRAAERVIMLVTPGADFLALSYAVMGRGAVPVFIDPGMGVDAVVACMREAQPTGFIGVPKAHLLRLKAAELFRSLRFCVVAGRVPLFGATRLRDLLKPAGDPPMPIPRQADDPALVAFTSGGTGRPKGVIFTNRMLTEQLAVFRGQFGFRGGEQDLPLLPVFSLFTAALGVGSIFPPLDPSRPLSLVPKQIIRVMRDLGNQTSCGSPTLWTKLAEYCRQTGESLPQLRRVFMAGAPVSQATLDLVKAACPQAESFTPYGATEALPVTVAAAAELRQHPPVLAVSGEQGTPVGRAIDGVTLRVVRPAVEPANSPLIDCGPREIGEIVVSGDTVSREYLSRPEATAASKVSEGGRVWHRMGDMGYLDADGQLYFCGRRVHVVTTTDRTFHSVPVENVFNRHPQVSRTALIGIDGGPALVVEPRSRSLTPDARRRLAAELRAIGASDPVTAPIRRFYFHHSFPVDARHNAKIFRDRLATWAATQEAIEVDEPGTPAAGPLAAGHA
jgi:acyl-CoA synthetase (AMP-forming)/AMP-acid ligase II/pimeloyl-ACP methyl ester carboxylesterase